MVYSSMLIEFAGRKIPCGEGETILSALGRAGIVLSAPCGGRGLCGKCRIRLISGDVRGTASPDRSSVRACGTFPRTDITIELLSEEIIDNEVGGIDSELTRRLPKRAGVALDLGTTTVSAKLVDLDTAEALDVRSVLNDQRIFGADVMSRINAAGNGKTGELFSLINRQTEKILFSFMEKYRLEKIEKLAVSGNTTMLHLFANIDPSGMGKVPFTPVFLEEKEFSGADLGLSAERVTLLPSISAFVGGDITAGLGTLTIFSAGENALFLDIGTNGEMALFHGGRLYCCSTAAGPAFEGAEISCGTGGVRGAINKIELKNGELSFTTIAGAPPVGLCGCGLIDAVAVMLKTGVIDETGAFCGKQTEFTIAPGISLINRDVRQFQLAKSAIMSGIKLLCKNAGIGLPDISGVFIAGGLGFFIDTDNAISVGLLPEMEREKIFVCGNLSLHGACLALTEHDFLSKCKMIIEKSETVDLASDPAFMDEFAENMLLGNALWTDAI